VVYSDLPSQRYVIIRITDIKDVAFCIKTCMAAHRRNSDETASHTLLRLWLPSLEMAIDTDFVIQNAFTFSYERAKT
jgi:hypothetical protein